MRQMRDRVNWLSPLCFLTWKTASCRRFRPRPFFPEGVTETQTEPTEDVHGERRLRWASHFCISSS